MAWKYLPSAKCMSILPFSWTCFGADSWSGASICLPFQNVQYISNVTVEFISKAQTMGKTLFPPYYWSFESDITCFPHVHFPNKMSYSFFSLLSLSFSTPALFAYERHIRVRSWRAGWVLICAKISTRIYLIEDEEKSAST